MSEAGGKAAEPPLTHRHGVSMQVYCAWGMYACMHRAAPSGNSCAQHLLAYSCTVRGVAAVAFGCSPKGQAAIYATGASRQLVALDPSSGEVLSTFDASKHALSCLAIAPGETTSVSREQHVHVGLVCRACP